MGTLAWKKRIWDLAPDYCLFWNSCIRKLLLLLLWALVRLPSRHYTFTYFPSHAYRALASLTPSLWSDSETRFSSIYNISSSVRCKYLRQCRPRGDNFLNHFFGGRGEPKPKWCLTFLRFGKGSQIFSLFLVNQYEPSEPARRKGLRAWTIEEVPACR